MRNLRMIALGASLVAFAFLVGCGGGSSSSSSGGLQTISSTGGNVAPISVNGGPAGIDYVDAAERYRHTRSTGLNEESSRSVNSISSMPARFASCSYPDLLCCGAVVLPLQPNTSARTRWREHRQFNA